MRKLKSERETENARYHREEIGDLRTKARMMIGNLAEAIEDPEEKIPEAMFQALRDQFGDDSVTDAARKPRGTEIGHRYSKHVAEVTLLESFDLGKNTAQNAGIEIRVFDKGAGKRGTQLGTIRIGQGSFAWWAKSAKIQTKKGKGKATLRLDWSKFADLMKREIKKEGHAKMARKANGHTAPKLGATFEATFKGKVYRMKVAKKDGEVAYLVGGKAFPSPSAAGMSVTGMACNGWRFWKID